MNNLEFEIARKKMVQQQLMERGILEPNVLNAMEAIRREVFVADEYRDQAYCDKPLPIGCSQTISQPYVVAYMIQHLDLKTSDVVLEIGAGSGYAAAVLSRIVKRVISIERFEKLADFAAKNIRVHEIQNVEIHRADGSCGWLAAAPYDAILISAAGPELPDSLKNQLRPGGRLVMPVGDRQDQQLIRVERVADDRFEIQDLGSVRFVPLIGKDAW